MRISERWRGGVVFAWGMFLQIADLFVEWGIWQTGSRVVLSKKAQAVRMSQKTKSIRPIKPKTCINLI